MKPEVTFERRGPYIANKVREVRSKSKTVRLVAMNISRPPTLVLVAVTIASLTASLTACGSTRPPAPEVDRTVVDTKPIDDKPLKEESGGDAKDNVLAEPIVNVIPTDPVSGRNVGFGPYDSLQAICGATQERCVMSKPVALSGSSAITRMASFIELPMDGNTSLACETKEGWYVSSVPDGRPFGGGLSHHTPAGTHFYFELAKADGDGVVLLRGFSQSTFMPGRGSSGSRSFEEVVRLKCGVQEARVACGEGKPVFGRACTEGKCKQTGVHPVRGPE